MCGFVGAIGSDDVCNDLTSSLKEIEHSEFDLTGIIIPPPDKKIPLKNVRRKAQGLNKNKIEGLHGYIGLGNNYWMSNERAFPRISQPYVTSGNIAIVQNGIIYNHKLIRERLLRSGYYFTSKSDIELIGHLLEHHIKSEKEIRVAVWNVLREIEGNYAITFLVPELSGYLIATCNGSMTVIGVGQNKYYVASNPLALRTVAREFIYLENGDVAEIRPDAVLIFDSHRIQVSRQLHAVDSYKRLPRIYIEPDEILLTLQGRICYEKIIIDAFGDNASDSLKQIERVQIVASNSSYYSGLIGKFWMEKIAGVSCEIESADIFRSRINFIEPNTLFVTVSHSGQDYDTLQSLLLAKSLNYTTTLAISSTTLSPLVKNSSLALMTGGITNSIEMEGCDFVIQMAGILLLCIAIGHFHRLNSHQEYKLVEMVEKLPRILQKTLALDEEISKVSKWILNKKRVMILGDDSLFYVALESASFIKKTASLLTNACPYFLFKKSAESLLEPDVAIISLVSSAQLEEFQDTITRLEAGINHITIITNAKESEKKPDSFHIIHLPESDDMLFHFTAATTMQLIAHHSNALKEVMVYS